DAEPREAAGAIAPAAMVRPVPELADILREHGPAWREANRGHVSLDQLKVMSAIERCRTAAPNSNALGPRGALRERGVRPYARRLQLVPRQALPEAPGCGVAPMAGRPGSGAAAGPVLSRRLHAAGQAARHRLAEQARGLRPP